MFSAIKLFSHDIKSRGHLSSNFHSFTKLKSQSKNALNHQPFKIFKRIYRSNSKTLNRIKDIISSPQLKRADGPPSVANLAKPKNLKRLIGLAKDEKWKLTGALLCLMVSSAVTLSVPYFIGKIIDLIYTSEKDKMMHNLTAFCTSLLAIFFIGGLANFGRVYVIQSSSQRIVKKLREFLFAKIMRQEIGFFDKNKTGELINRLSSDTLVVSQALSQNISDGFRSILQAVTGVGMMTFISVKLTLISMGIVPPVAVGAIIYGRYLRKITKRVQNSLADATHVAEERIATIRTVRAFAHEDKECQAYNNCIEKVLQLSYKESLARATFWGFAGFSGNIIIISVFYFGGSMMMQSNISVGDLSAFLMYAAYVGASLNGITSFFTELNRGVAASDRIWDIMDRQPLIELDYLTRPLKTLDTIKGDLKLSNVSFSYPSRSEMEIFKDLCLEIPSGSVTALVGPSGSGKSTISSLLLRLYDPSSGVITLDGHDIRNLNPNWLRSNIGLVSQDPVLLSTSIAENIAYGAEKPEAVTAEEIIEAAKKANAYNFIMEFPNGFETSVGERGIMLSGGQRQRVAIARAILKNPKILILDEATSALDAESEYQVQEALERLMVGRTVLVIAHRLSTIKSANKIVVLDEGKTHKDNCETDFKYITCIVCQM
ncbi:ATP-binding cassette sub- B member 10, mitochondrial [Bulinus truncatus]|nr:ATP-binding cassette sub- B member 10, mitochondrial [Bulinus truncatus]